MVVDCMRLWCRRAFNSMGRLILWPFRSEMRMFLSLSGLLLSVCILESILNPDDSDLDTLDFVPLSNETMLPSRSNDVYYNIPFNNMSTFIPLVFCLLAVFYVCWKICVFFLFGSLTSNERISISKSLFRFILFRFIILSGAINPAKLSSLFGWLLWFGILGILHMLVSTTSSRCRQVSVSGTIPKRQWTQISFTFLILFFGTFCLCKVGLNHCFLLADIDVSDFEPDSTVKMSLLSSLKSPTVLGALKAKLTGKKESMFDAVDVVALLLCECALLLCTITQLSSGIIIQAYDRWCMSKGRSWVYQSTFSYYSEFVFSCLSRVIEVAHYLHLLLWSRLFSVASLVVFLHIRVSYLALAACISRHLSQSRLKKFINENYELCKADYPVDTDSFDCGKNGKGKRLGNDSVHDSINEKYETPVCAICWDVMINWRRLPCRHDFHEHCLRFWLEQNPSCPTCRRDLSIPSTVLPNAVRSQRSENMALGMLVRNLFNNIAADNPTRQNLNELPTARPLPVLQPNRGSLVPRMFATSIGFNLGLSFGAGPVVTAAAQAATVPRDSGLLSLSNSNDTAVSQVLPTGNRDSDPSSSTITNIQQINATNDTPNNDQNNQVRHRSFHFNGSHYFSWLPSLHVELSEVFREVFPVGVMQALSNMPPLSTDENVLGQTTEPGQLNSGEPNNRNLPVLSPTLASSVDQLASMFPQFPRSTIVNELLITGVPELAVENLIGRSASIISSTSSNINNTTDDTIVTNRNLIEARNEHLERGEIRESADLSDSEGSVDFRGLSLSSRRKLMLARARKNFLAKHKT